ncbi:MAG TPA: RHS repeat-associated core domain-containing protein, partial [Bryobacteraceae bacterium]|nr:RHS repeat-associated core domain-containing protein [Bryobacteraceae bacterium]
PNGGTPVSGLMPQTNLYNAANQRGDAAYDAAGNQLTIGGTTLTYDAENRVVSASNLPAYGGGSETYVYDGDGRRVQKIVIGGNTTTYVHDIFGKLIAEYSTNPPAPTPPCHTCYISTDHLGSTRLVTGDNASIVARHDYVPFGEEIPGGYAGRTSEWGATDNVNQKFTGKERDVESGLDYFGARYYGAALARFASPDPLMASAHASNPQSWNRYAYALNNPLRFVDPDGMDVPTACAQDKNCQIVVKVNVVYDKTVHNGNGLTNKEKKTFEKNQLEKAQKDFGNSNIKLEFTYTQGSYTVNDNGQTQLTGLKSDSLNLVVSTTTPTGEAGVSGLAGNGTAVSFLNFNDVNNSNVGPLWSNTTEHELGHQFLGDPFKGYTPNGLEHWWRDAQIDSLNTTQGVGFNERAYREGLEPRRYAAPANPEANKPQQ